MNKKSTLVWLVVTLLYLFLLPGTLSAAPRLFQRMRIAPHSEPIKIDGGGTWVSAACQDGTGEYHSIPQPGDRYLGSSEGAYVVRSDDAKLSLQLALSGNDGEKPWLAIEGDGSFIQVNIKRFNPLDNYTYKLHVESNTLIGPRNDTKLASMHQQLEKQYQTSLGKIDAYIQQLETILGSDSPFVNTQYNKKPLLEWVRTDQAAQSDLVDKTLIKISKDPSIDGIIISEKYYSKKSLYKLSRNLKKPTALSDLVNEFLSGEDNPFFFEGTDENSKLLRLTMIHGAPLSKEQIEALNTLNRNNPKLSLKEGSEYRAFAEKRVDARKTSEYTDAVKQFRAEFPDDTALLADFERTVQRYLMQDVPLFVALPLAGYNSNAIAIFHKARDALEKAFSADHASFVASFNRDISLQYRSALNHRRGVSLETITRTAVNRAIQDNFLNVNMAAQIPISGMESSARGADLLALAQGSPLTDGQVGALRDILPKSFSEGKSLKDVLLIISEKDGYRVHTTSSTDNFTREDIKGPNFRRLIEKHNEIVFHGEIDTALAEQLKSNGKVFVTEFDALSQELNTLPKQPRPIFIGSEDSKAIVDMFQIDVESIANPMKEAGYPGALARSLALVKQKSLIRQIQQATRLARKNGFEIVEKQADFARLNLENSLTLPVFICNHSLGDVVRFSDGTLPLSELAERGLIISCNTYRLMESQFRTVNKLDTQSLVEAVATAHKDALRQGTTPLDFTKRTAHAYSPKRQASLIFEFRGRSCQVQAASKSQGSTTPLFVYIPKSRNGGILYPVVADTPNPVALVPRILGRVRINGKDISVSPEIDANNMFVSMPLRAIVEGAGGTIKWLHQEKTASGRVRDTSFSVNIRSRHVSVDEQPVTTDAKVYLKEDHIMVPLELIQQILAGSITVDTEGVLIFNMLP